MKKNKLQVIRIIIQSLFLLLVSVLAWLHQVKGGGPNGAPSIDSICPFGGVETIYKYLAGGEYIKRIYPSNIALLIAIILLVIFVSRYFCGWICALGTLQEFFTKLGKRIFNKKFILPKILDKYLRYFKYLVLILVLVLTYKTGELIIRPYDPFAAYGHLFAGIEELINEFLIGTIILFGSLILSMFYERFFCKYMCPLGAFLGIINKLSLFKIKREESTCIQCDLCNKQCPVNIDVANSSIIKSSECITCLECVSGCPTGKNTLSTTLFGKMIKPMSIVIIGVSIYVGVIGITYLTNFWQTSEVSIEQEMEESGSLNPDNIRGYMTLKEISDSFGIDKNILYKKLELSIEKYPPDTKAKDLKSLVSQNEGREFEVEEIREVIKEILGITSEIHEESKNIFEINGEMTIKDIVAAVGGTGKEVVEKLGLPESIPKDVPLKDLQSEYNFKVSDLKENAENF